MILNREPAVFYGLVAALIQLASALFLHLTVDQQGVLNAAVVAVGGCVVAWQVAAEKGIAFLAGVAKSLIAVALAFGWHASPELQSSIMTLVTMAVAFFTRTQVIAPPPADVAEYEHPAV